MSAISAKALNSTLGTENFKGFDEIFIQKMSELIEASKPKKIQTVQAKLQFDFDGLTEVDLSYAVDTAKSKIEISSWILINAVKNENYPVHYIAPSFSSSNKISIRYSLSADAYVTLTVTSY